MSLRRRFLNRVRAVERLVRKSPQLTGHCALWVWRLLVRNRLAIAVASLLWLIFRSGSQPRRLSYPCQQVAAVNVGAFVAGLIPALFLTRKNRCPHTLDRAVRIRRQIVAAGIMFVTALIGIEGYQFAQSLMPDWMNDPPPRLAEPQFTTVGIVRQPPAGSTYTTQEIEDMVRRAIDLAGGLDDVIAPGDTVVIKPNLVKANWPGTQGVVTDPRVCAAVVQVAQDAGAGQITIVEGTAVGTTGRNCTWEAFTDAGYDTNGNHLFDYDETVALYDLNDSGGLHQTNPDKVTLVTVPNGVIRTQYYVPNILLESDVMICVPTFKNHGNGTVTLSLKNRVGCAPSDIYHSDGSWGQGVYGKLALVHHCDEGFPCTVPPTPGNENEIVQRSLVDLNLVRPQDFEVIDALIGVTNGPCPEPQYLEHPDPHMQMIIAGRDSLAVDTVGTLAMGYDPRFVPHLLWADSTGVLGTIDTRYITVAGDHVAAVRSDDFPEDYGYPTPAVLVETDPPWLADISWTEGQQVVRTPENPVGVTGVGDGVGVVKAELVLTPIGVPDPEPQVVAIAIDPAVPDFEIEWNAMGMDLGLYTATVTVYDAALNEASITRTIELVAPVTPVIYALPKAFTHTVFVAESPDDDIFTVANVGVGTLEYEVEVSEDWVSLSAYAGTVVQGAPPDSVTIYYDCRDLDPGGNTATITASDAGALNSPQTITVTVNVETVPPDLDFDGDVDQEDVGYLQACLAGPGSPITDPKCTNADLDGDGDIDHDDFVVLRGCMSGASVPPVKGCADQPSP